MERTSLVDKHRTQTIDTRSKAISKLPEGHPCICQVGRPASLGALGLAAWSTLFPDQHKERKSLLKVVSSDQQKPQLILMEWNTQVFGILLAETIESIGNC